MKKELITLATTTTLLFTGCTQEEQKKGNSYINDLSLSLKKISRDIVSGKTPNKYTDKQELCDNLKTYTQIIKTNSFKIDENLTILINEATNKCKKVLDNKKS